MNRPLLGDQEKAIRNSRLLSKALAHDIARSADLQGIDPQELVRELFLQHLPEFVADALAETLTNLRSNSGAEEVDSS
jgi:hypothetical protein